MARTWKSMCLCISVSVWVNLRADVACMRVRMWVTGRVHLLNVSPTNIKVGLTQFLRLIPRCSFFSIKCWHWQIINLYVREPKVFNGSQESPILSAFINLYAFSKLKLSAQDFSSPMFNKCNLWYTHTHSLTHSSTVGILRGMVYS